MINGSKLLGHTTCIQYVLMNLTSNFIFIYLQIGFLEEFLFTLGTLKISLFIVVSSYMILKYIQTLKLKYIVLTSSSYYSCMNQSDLHTKSFSKDFLLPPPPSYPNPACYEISVMWIRIDCMRIRIQSGFRPIKFQN